jgi:hypothetical protein
MLVIARRYSQERSTYYVEVNLDGVQILSFGGFVARAVRTAPSKCSEEASAQIMYTVEFLRAPD